MEIINTQNSINPISYFLKELNSSKPKHNKVQHYSISDGKTI